MRTQKKMLNKNHQSSISDCYYMLSSQSVILYRCLYAHAHTCTSGVCTKYLFMRLSRTQGRREAASTVFFIENSRIV